MLILNQSKTCIINTDFRATVYVSDRKVLTKEEKLAEYKSGEQAVWVLGMIFAAMTQGEKAFEMPTQMELDNVPRQHRSHCTDRKVGHGGS